MNMMAPSLARPRDDIYTTLKRLGLATGLHICLDAGDDISAPASTTKWVDLSGGGNGYFRGSSGSAEASLDMDFVGTVGRRDKDAYWTNGGGTEYFTFEKSITTPINDAHKNNQKWSLMAWWYVDSLGGVHHLFNTNSSNASSGVFVDVVTNLLRLFVQNGSGTSFVGSTFSSANVVAGWNFIGIAVEITSNVLTVNINTGARKQDGVAPTMTGTPSSAAAQGVPKMFASNNAATLSTLGDRANSFCWWGGVKRTAAEYEAIFQATRSKFGV